MKTLLSALTLVAVFTCIAITPATAQPVGVTAGSGGTDEPHRDNLLQLTADIQIKLVQELYALTPEQATRLHDEVPNLIPEQKAHEARIDLTLRRLSLARAFVEKDVSLSAEEKAARLATFEKQYHDLTAKGPLSLAAIVRRAEALLSPEQLAKAKADIAAKYADRLPPQTPITPETLHALFSGPMPKTEVPEVRRPAAPPPPAPTPTPQTTPPVPAQPAPTPTTPPQPATPPPPVNRPVTPPAPPKVFKPAPPLAEWPSFVEETITKINYTPEQKNLAQNILDSCRKRAEEHLTQQKAEYDAAAQIADPAAKEEKLAQLNLSLIHI